MKKDLICLLVAITILNIGCSSSKTSQTNDGLSFETAIKVNSVEKEYKLLPNLCPECNLTSQGTTSKGNKHYDIMTMIKPSGEKVVYYFDITSFFGNF